MFRIYKNDELIVEGESPLTITGIEPDTQVVEGTYQAVRVENEEESERVDIPAFKTLPIKVASVTVAPKTNNLEVGATRQLNTTIEPTNATNQKVTYESDDETIAKVNASGLITAIGAGTATVTVKTEDGNHTDTATVNVTKPPEITTEEVTEKIDIVEYETIRNETETLPKGEEEVVQEGKDGYTEVTYEVTYEDGVEVSREEIDRKVIEPVDEIINVGTYEEPEPEPEPDPEPEE